MISTIYWMLNHVNAAVYVGIQCGNVIEAHCYIVQYKQIDCEQWRGKINQSTDCRTFQPHRPSYAADKCWNILQSVDWLHDSATSLLKIYSPISIWCYHEVNNRCSTHYTTIWPESLKLQDSFHMVNVTQYYLRTVSSHYALLIMGVPPRRHD